MLNILQSERKPRKKGQEPGMQGTGDGRFGPPTPPPSPVYKPKVAWGKLQVPLYNLKTLLAGSATKRNNPAMHYKIYTSATITDRIQPSYNLRQTRLKNFSAPYPLPPSNKFQGWEKARFGFCAASSLGWSGLCCSILFCPRLLSTLLWGGFMRRKIRAGHQMSIGSKQKQDDKNRLLWL